MTKSKKLLSILLCVAMLLSTAVVGFTGASAAESGVKSYEELDEEYDDFLYLATEFYDKDDNLLADDTVVDQGDEIVVKFYLKSDIKIYKYAQLIAFDSSLVQINDGGEEENIDNYETPTSTAAALEIIDSSVFYDADGEEVLVFDELSEYYKADDFCYVDGKDVIPKYTIAKLSNTTASAASVKSDDPICGFKISVKKDATPGASIKASIIKNVNYFENGTNKDWGYITSGRATSYKSSVDNYLTTDVVTHSIKVNDKITMTFTDGTTTKTVSHKPGEDLVPPEEIEAFAWIKSGDKTKTFVNFADEKNSTAATTYNAVKADEKISLTIDPNGGAFEDGSTAAKTVDVSVSEGFDPSAYNVTKSNGTIRWAIAKTGSTAETTVDGTYAFPALTDYTVKAYWESSIVVKVATAEGEWVDFTTYAAADGKAIDDNDIIAIQKYVNANYDALAELVGYDPYFGNAAVNAKTFSETAADWASFARNAGAACTKLSFTNETKSKGEGYDGIFTFGTDNIIYLNTVIAYTFTINAPKFDEDGKVITDEDGKFGKKWDVVYTETKGFVAVGMNKDGEPEAFIGADDTENTIFTIKDEKINSALVKDGQPVIDEYLFTTIYKDSKGNTIQKASGASGNYMYGYASDVSEDVPDTIELYVDVTDREYVIAFSAGVGAEAGNRNLNQKVSTTTFKFGDIISIASLTYDNYTIDELKEDGAKANVNGYKLKRIFLDDIDLTEGGTVEITKEFVDKAQTGSDPSNYKLTFDSEWEAKAYTFTVYYMNASKEWVELTEKDFTGSETIAYNKIVTSDLEEILGSDCHESVKYTPGSLASDKEGTLIGTVRAYDGPMDLYISYSSSDRYYFEDYQSSDELSVRFKRGSARYGTQLYIPGYDGDLDNRPVVNGIEAAYNPASDVERKPDTDSEGNPKYEYLYTDVLDDEGNPVIDPVTNKPVQEIATDENGNKLFDESKPIYKDPKGSSAGRPYRNCEYMGFKVYYVDGVYTNAADLPAQSEWKEGYNANGGEDYGLYTTVIIQYQWKSDADFIIRVYDESGKIYSALGKNLKWYYWFDDKPCSKSEAKLNADPENYIILMLLIKSETAEYADGQTGKSFYLQAFRLGKPSLSPAFIPGLLPTIMDLIKGLL